MSTPTMMYNENKGMQGYRLLGGGQSVSVFKPVFILFLFFVKDK